MTKALHAGNRLRDLLLDTCCSYDAVHCPGSEFYKASADLFGHKLVYIEVPYGCEDTRIARADIVVRNGPRTTTIECKSQTSGGSAYRKLLSVVLDIPHAPGSEFILTIGGGRIDPREIEKQILRTIPVLGKKVLVLNTDETQLYIHDFFKRVNPELTLLRTA